MKIEVSDFSENQKQALFDLLILAMYADGHLTTSEDKEMEELLSCLGHTDEFARQKEFDAAVTRIRPSLESLVRAKEHAVRLAEAFTERSHRRRVYDAVQKIMTSDAHVSSWETTLLSELRLKFRV